VRVREICLLGAALSVVLGGCSDQTNPRVATRLNHDAMLVGDLPSNPLQGKVITSWVSKQDATMSTMFGNGVAWQYARTNAEMQYPAGSVLSVVTWGQQEDPRWFGGSIPQRAKAVEFVTVTERGGFRYERYEGSPLKRVVTTNVEDLDAATKRGSYLMARRAAVMP
jgi:hypothetical protein